MFFGNKKRELEAQKERQREEFQRNEQAKRRFQREAIQGSHDKPVVVLFKSTDTQRNEPFVPTVFEAVQKIGDSVTVLICGDVAVTESLDMAPHELPTARTIYQGEWFDRIDSLCGEEEIKRFVSQVLPLAKQAEGIREEAAVRQAEAQQQAAAQQADAHRDAIKEINAIHDNLLNPYWFTYTEGQYRAVWKKLLQEMAPQEREILRHMRLLTVIGGVTNEEYSWFLQGLITEGGNAPFKMQFADGSPIPGRDYYMSSVGTEAWIQAGHKTGTFPTKQGVLQWALERFNAIISNHADTPSGRLLKEALMGGNAWLTRDGIPGSIYEERTDASLVLGPLAEEAGTVLQYSGNGSLITLAPPGAGKTQCHVLENLVRYKGPAFVLDVKGDAWEHTSKWRAKNVGPVWRFDPLSPEQSSHYNPFALIGNRRTWMEARHLAKAVKLPESGRGDSYFEDRPLDFITALLFFVAREAPKERRNMLEVCRRAWGGDEAMDTLWAKMSQMEDEGARQTAANFVTVFKNAPKQYLGVLDNACRSLEIWRDPEVVAITKDSDPEWQPVRLRQAPYPTVYLCISPRDIEAYASVLRVIISQHIRALTAELPKPGDPSVLFCLDELPRLGEMLPVQEGVEVGRQYGVRLWLFAQHFGQLRNAYPASDSMVGACAVRAFMNPRAEDGTAQKVSDMLGFREGILDGQRHRVAEVTDLTGPDYKDIQIVFGDGARPAKLHKNFAYRDPSLADRLGEYSPA